MNNSADATIKKASGQMAAYVAGKKITDEQWDEILRRFRIEALAILCVEK